MDSRRVIATRAKPKRSVSCLATSIYPSALTLPPVISVSRAAMPNTSLSLIPIFIRQSEFFLYSPKDKEAVFKCKELVYEFPEITSWIRAKKEDFQLVKDLEIKETGILVSCSDYHIFNKFGWTRQQAMDNYLSVVEDVYKRQELCSAIR